MKNIKSFYKNKKIFVTGHTGFKGSWLVSVLLKFGAKVTGYSLNDEKRNNYENFVNHKKIKNIYGDICDFDKLKKSIKKAKPQIIFHLAAQPLVADSYTDPLNTLKTNFMGSINILEIVRKFKNIKSLVMITSDKCYLNREILRGYKENDRLGGNDPYSASKAAIEIVFQSYLNSFFLKKNKIGIGTARAGNVIGGGDWSKNRIIPDCIRTIIRKKSLVVRNPLSTRPWQHVLEPVSGYLLLGKKLFINPRKFSGSWNFGPSANEVKNVKEVAKIIISHIEKGRKTRIIFKKGSFEEANLLKLNSEKANKFLNWKTKWTMNQALKKTAVWYNFFLKKKNTKELTDKQIENYF